MSDKCKMVVAGGDKHTIRFVCTVGHDRHSIYQRRESMPFEGVVNVSRKLWATRSRGVRI